MVCCSHSSSEISIFLPGGLDLYKLGLGFSMCRVTVLIADSFLGEEAELCLEDYIEMHRFAVKSWFYIKRGGSPFIFTPSFPFFMFVF